MRKLLTLAVSTFLIIGCNEKPTATEDKEAKTEAFSIGLVDTLKSEILNEKRILNIYLPDDYSPDSARTYPVIYLLDGSDNEDFIHAVGVLQFQSVISQQTLPCIVVGIANVDRRRDFSFPTNNERDKKDFPTTGGSEKFISFIEQELKPHIQSKFKTNKTELLIGQSLGGLLASEILLKKPQLFSHYCIVSPSLWWDDESLLKLAPQLITQHDYSGKHIFISAGGKEEEQMLAASRALSELLNHASGSDWSHSYYPLPEEDHLTILHNAIYKALPLLLPTSNL